ncbi:hypothetical protein ACM66B_004320 [Microbotryomycetes sp. NB124-2]
MSSRFAMDAQQSALDDDSQTAAGQEHYSDNDNETGAANDLEAEPLEQAERDKLYSILNVERAASHDDVVKAYKRLAGESFTMFALTTGAPPADAAPPVPPTALLHPDRHPDSTLKAAADARFQQLNEAFDVLSDPQKRAVYDELGEQGLKMQWDLGPRNRTPAEIRAEFEKAARKQLETDVEGLVRSRGELTVITDARVLFLADEERRQLGGPPAAQDMSFAAKLATVATRQMVLKHSYTTPLDSKTSLVLTSQLLTRNGAGGGNVIGKVVYTPSSRWSIQIGTTALRPRALILRGTFVPDSDSSITVNAPVKTLTAPPQITVTMARRVFEQVTAVFTLRSGIWALGPWGREQREATVTSTSTVTLGLNHHRGWGIECTSGVMSQQLSATYSTTLLGSFKVTAGGVVSSEGAASVFVESDKKVTEHIRAGLGLDLGMTGTMTVKVKFSRLGQRMTLPIVVASTWEPRLIVAFTAGPTLAVVAAHHLVIRPRKRRKAATRLAELRKEHAEYLETRRREADDAVRLLEQHVRKKMAAERASNGLVIEEARYGIIKANHAQGEGEERVLDVTIAVQALVANSQLVIPGGRSKSSLLGFYDCAIGERKRLYIKYLFRGKLHEVTVVDNEPVAAPLRSHCLE